MTDTIRANLIAKQQLAGKLALAGYFSLFFLLMANIIWLIPSRHFPTGLVLLVLVTPLLFPLKGLLEGRTYTYQWASFLALPYFAHGITEIAAYPEFKFAGITESLSSVLMFIGCIVYAKYAKTLKIIA